MMIIISDIIYAKLIKKQVGDQNDANLLIENINSSEGKKEGDISNAPQPVKLKIEENQQLNENDIVPFENEERKGIEEQAKEKEKLKLEEEYFSQSKDKLLSFLSGSKGTIFIGAFFSSCSGAVWPVYGVILGISIDALSNPNLNLVYDNGFFMAMMFLIIAGVAAISITLQK